MAPPEFVDIQSELCHFPVFEGDGWGRTHRYSVSHFMLGADCIRIESPKGKVYQHSMLTLLRSYTLLPTPYALIYVPWPAKSPRNSFAKQLWKFSSSHPQIWLDHCFSVILLGYQTMECELEVIDSAVNSWGGIQHQLLYL